MSEEETGAGPEPGLERRTFLKITGAAVMAPAIAAPRELLADRSAIAARAGAASPRTTAFSPDPVLVGGALVRPPSVPLAVRSPYLSTWLPATDLTATTPQFWTGSARGFAGLVRVDGHVYWWAGLPSAGGTAA